jgi:hypothetical protein
MFLGSRLVAILHREPTIGIPRHAFVLRHRAKDRIQRLDPELLVCWYVDAVM